MIRNRSIVPSFLLFISLLIISTSCKSPTQAEDPYVLLRLKNQSGFDLKEVNTRFHIGFDRIELEFGTVKNGDVTDYQELPLEILDDDGHYCKRTVGYSNELGFLLTMALLCPGLNPDRADIITFGQFTLTLEYILSEFLNLSLVTHSNEISDVQVRIKNNSDKYFLNILAKFPGNDTVDPVEIDFGSVASGQYSEFVSVELAYRYTHLIVTTETETIDWEPIDYVGETPLSPGKYSYSLDFVEGLKDVSKISRD